MKVSTSSLSGRSDVSRNFACNRIILLLLFTILLLVKWDNFFLSKLFFPVYGLSVFSVYFQEAVIV